MFLISTPSYNLFILSTSINPDMKINQMLFYKVNLGIFGPRAFDCRAETKLTSEDAFLSQTFWAYSFHRSFNFPVEWKDPLFSVFVTYYILIYVLFLRKTTRQDLMDIKLDIFYCTVQTRNCTAKSQVSRPFCKTVVTKLFWVLLVYFSRLHLLVRSPSPGQCITYGKIAFLHLSSFCQLNNFPYTYVHVCIYKVLVVEVLSFFLLLDFDNQNFLLWFLKKWCMEKKGNLTALKISKI